jgi:hypothetical protein
MKKAIAYLLIFFFALIALFIIHDIIQVPSWYINRLLFAKCAYVGGIGGILYCLRSVYLNRSLRKQWDNDWEVWYYLRPIASSISGFVSCIFLKAGLLVLEASNQTDNSLYGYLAIAFIAGYNVDNFLKRLESIAHSAWGISKSRISKEDNSSEGRKE